MKRRGGGWSAIWAGRLQTRQGQNHARRRSLALPEDLESRSLLAITVIDTASAWKATATAPAAGWTTAAFDDSAFVAATPGGSVTLGGTSVVTVWGAAGTNEVWLRRTFSLDGRPAAATLDMTVDDDVDLFVNGVQVVADTNNSPTTQVGIDVASYLKAGTNVLAARARNLAGTGGRYFATRASIDTERADAGGTTATALTVGVVPGLAIAGATLADAADVDVYKVDLLKSDSIVAKASFDVASGSAAPTLQVLDSAGTVISTGMAASGVTQASLTNLAAGTYYLRVAGGGSAKSWYGLSVTPSSTSTTRVIYVNDGRGADDVYTLAPGNDANDGLAPERPKASLQNVLATYALGPTTLVVVDAGTYGGSGTPSYGEVVVTSADEGTTFAGAATGTGSRFVYGGTRIRLQDSDQMTIRGLVFAGSGGTGIEFDTGSAGTAAAASSNARIDANTFTGLSYGIVSDGGAQNVFSRNAFSNTTTSIAVWASSSAPADGLEIRGNTFSMTGTSATGASISNAATAIVADNTFTGGTVGLDVWSVASVSLLTNSFAGATSVAARVQSGTATVRGNTFGSSATGLIVWTGGVVEANTFTGNTTGLSASSASLVVRGNTVTGNTTGLTGVAQFGGTDWTTGQANTLTGNTIGIRAISGATVAFNAISGGTTGIAVASDSGSSISSVSVHHNVVAGQTGTGVVIAAARDVSIVNNTVVPAAAGGGIRLQSASENVSIRNTIVSVDAGTGLHVATDSQVGFASDSNNFYRTPTGTGVLVWFQKPFRDLFDWQVEADYDTRSIGYTAPDPTRDAPQFVDAAGGDYRLAAGSTSIDAGQPADTFALEPGVNGGRIDLGAYGNTALATESAARQLRIAYPEYYVDWPAAEGRAIQWGTYDSSTTDKQLAGFVRVELHRVGTGKVADIATVAASAGSYGWSPQASGIVPSVADRYRIVIRSVEHPAVVDTSREAFSIPAESGAYFVDDGADTADEYTPAASGSNRNTGATAADPKANLLALLRSYDLGGGDTVFIDSGDYVHVRNVVISGEVGRGDDEGARFTGPTDVAKVARIDRANTGSFATTIDVSDGDFVTLERLTLTGGHKGLWVRSGSTNFTGRDLVVTNNTADGILIESDSVGTVVGRLTATGNAGTGISIATPIATLSDSVASNNGQYGISLSNTGATRLEANTVAGNRYGIYASNTYPYTWADATVIGNPNLALGRGNRITGNAEYGVLGQGAVWIVGNAVSDQATGVGVRLQANAVAERNLLADNRTAVSTTWFNYAQGGIIRNNRITGSTDWAIVSVGGDITGNVLSGNAAGITVDANFNHTIANNVVAGSTTTGLRIAGTYSSYSASVVNNTFSQGGGAAVLVTGGARNARFENNIFSITGGRAFEVAADSQQGFASDSNLFHLQGTAELGLWQAVVRPTLSAWRSAATTDLASLAADPRFVNAAGGDFHVQSPAGSFHGGSLAPIAGGTGLPASAGGDFVADAARSPAIDRGKEGYSVANEPAPNGGFIEIGAYGNTAQASKSAATYVLVTAPDGGESIPAGRNVTLRWRAENLGASGTTVKLELIRDAVGSTPIIVAAAAANTGESTFFLPADTIPAGDYRLRVTRNDVAETVDTSDAAFTITAPINLYYVNDATFAAGDFATAAGNDANDGLDPSRPKATISALLAAYDLGAGDVILVDAGTYALGADIQISPDDSGVTIRGFSDAHDAGRRALLDRGNRSSGTAVIRLSGADDVTLERLSLTGGYYGVYAASGADADRLTIRDSVFLDAAGTGETYRFVYLTPANSSSEPASDAATITGSTFTLSGSNSYNPQSAIDIGASATVTGNTVVISNRYGSGIATSGGTVSGNTVTGGSWGISYSGNGTISGNDVSGQSGTGISVSGYGGTMTVSGNRVYRIGIEDANSSAMGIRAYQNSNTLVADNEVWSVFGVGIGLYNATARGNTVYLCGTGISDRAESYGGQYAVIESNRVFANTTGISAVGNYNYASNITVRNNTVYSNSVGIAMAAYFGGTVANNLVYANTNTGISGGTTSWYSSTSRIVNNTVYQPVGDAIALTGTGVKIVENNIIRVDVGYALNVANDAQAVTRSDFNLFHLTGVGAKLARWQGVDIASLDTWRLAIGQDRGSRAGDPQFVDVDGGDGMLGFVTEPITGTVVIIDDGDAGFTTTNTWSAQATGRGGDSLRGSYSSSVPYATAQWEFTGLEPGALYEVAVTWAPWNNASSAAFRLADGGATVASKTFNQTVAPDDFTADGSAWERLGIARAASGTLTVSTNNSGRSVVADAVRLVKVQGNRAADDDFRVLATSPSINAGNPLDFGLLEPFPNGGRVNQGHTGNTSAAVPSAAQTVQVLAPNGLEKLETGSPAVISWRSSGLVASQPALLMNVGGAASGTWQGETYQATTNRWQTTYSGTPVTTGVTNPAPDDVYRSYAYPSSSTTIGWQIPAVDGTYTLRLHFVEPNYYAPYARTFDVVAQNALVADDFDLMAAAGAAGKVVVRDYTVTASGGTGISLRLDKSGTGNYFNGKYNYDPLLCGIELLAVNPSGTASPTAAVDVSLDNGATWTTIATGVALDRYGQGQTTWTPATATAGNIAMVRVRSGVVSDTSDTGFLVANSGTSYYVNDGSLAGDVFTTAVGDDRNDGKSPGAPMANLASLLAAYDLDAGDTIYVDAGTYAVLRDIVIEAPDSGVRIVGPATGTALLDRGNRSSGTSVIRLSGADDVTLERLSLTGGYYGVYAASGADADRLTIRDSVFFDAAGTGYTSYFVYLESSNDAATITGSTFTVTNSSTYSAVYVNASATVTGNTITNITTSGTGIYTSGGGTVGGNTVTGGYTGISMGGSGTVSGNDVSGQSYRGIEASGSGGTLTVSGNRVRNLTSSGAMGISCYEAIVTTNDVWNVGGTGIRNYGSSSLVRDNTVSLSGVGISTESNSGSTIESNRVFANTTGISAQGSYNSASNITVRNNTVYSNSVGIAMAAYFGGTVANNLVYANTNTGISGGTTSWYSSTSRIVNNTVYQPVGDAIALTGTGVKIVENNIIRVDVGYAFSVASSAVGRVTSNTNIFQIGVSANARVGLWGSTQAATLAAWRTASSQDAASAAADPLFRDIDGADDVLGYTTAGSGYDGGRDDNFGLRFGSPAIDAANATLAPATDMFGNSRVDDLGTPNVGGSIADIGAIEFISSSLDATPPRITATVPARVFSQGTWGITTQIDLTFSEAVDAIDALAARNYRLVESVNGTFGDADDVVHGMVPSALVSASGGVTQVRLAIATAGGLPSGLFRLTALGGTANGIRDLAGNMLDGNADGTAGGDFVRTFTINRTLDITPPTALFGAVESPRTTPLGSITVTFDEPVTGVSVSDFTLTRDGTPVSLAGASLSGSGSSYTLGNLASITTSGGTYVLTLVAAGSGIADTTGNLLERNAARNWTLSGGTIVVDAGQTATDTSTRTGIAQIVKKGAGTLILDRANSHSGGTVVEAGAVVVKNTSALGTGEVRVKAGARLILDVGIDQVDMAALVVEPGATVEVGAGRFRVVTGATAADLTPLLSAGFNDGWWNGSNGITSAAAAAATAAAELRSIGWVDNGDGSFTVGFAAPSDTNLDGLSDVLDAANFLAEGLFDSGTGNGWSSGDFNYDGLVDILDAAGFLGAGVFDAGWYLPGSQAATAGIAGSLPQTLTTADLAFAALAQEEASQPTPRKRAFATL